MTDAAIEAQIAHVEMARRVPGWSGPPLSLAPGLPPLTRLADRTMVARRRRFHDVMGWGADLPPEATIEDRLAAGYQHQEETTDQELAALTAFFDQQADAIDPAWRDGRPADPTAATAWARVEAATLHGDRFFGRRRGGPVWSALSGAIWRLAEHKRRRWG